MAFRYAVRWENIERCKEVGTWSWTWEKYIYEYLVTFTWFLCDTGKVFTLSRSVYSGWMWIWWNAYGVRIWPNHWRCMFPRILERFCVYGFYSAVSSQKSDESLRNTPSIGHSIAFHLLCVCGVCVCFAVPWTISICFGYPIINFISGLTQKKIKTIFRIVHSRCAALCPHLAWIRNIHTFNGELVFPHRLSMNRNRLSCWTACFLACIQMLNRVNESGMHQTRLQELLNYLRYSFEFPIIWLAKFFEFLNSFAFF